MATYKDDLDILKAAEKDSNKLSLNAITELDNKGMLGMYGGGSSKAIPDEFGLMIFIRAGEVPTPEWGDPDNEYHLCDYITKDFNYVSSMFDRQVQLTVATENEIDDTIVYTYVGQVNTFDSVDGAYQISKFACLPSGEIYFVAGGK